MEKRIVKTSEFDSIDEAMDDLFEDDNSSPVDGDAILDIESNRENINNIKKISEELKKQGIPLSLDMKIRYDDFLKWKEYFHCFNVSGIFWGKLSEFKEWASLIKKERLILSVESLGNGKMQVGVSMSDSKSWDSAKPKIKKVLDSFFKKNNVLDYFQNCSFVNISSFPETEHMDNYAEKERKMYEIAKEGLESNKNFKLMLMGNTGTGKTYFSKIISRHLIETKRVDCVVWGTLGSVSEILDIKKYFELSTRILFVADELEFDSARREKDSSTSMVIKFFDNMENYDDIKFIGISNLPDLIDPAMFRPERIDMMIFSCHSKMTEESIMNILKSLNKKNSNCSEKELKELSSFIISKYKEGQLPNSFYSLSLKLYLLYKKDTKKIAMIMDEFYKKKNLYDFKNDKFDNVGKMGF